MTAPARAAEQQLRTRIAASATLTLGGVVLSLTEARLLGGWLTVGSIVVLLSALHRLGRLGPDTESLGR